jgi:transcriptional regulator with XRE-family HTH domain
VIRETVSDQIAQRVRDLRERTGLSREQLADAAREAGAAPDFTAAVLRFLETGRPDSAGVRTRLFALDELWALALALEVTPLELLGDTAGLFVGDSADVRVSVKCPTCVRKAESGGLEEVARTDLAGLGDLSTLETTLVETAYRLAAAIDAGEDARALPGLTKELRATVQELSAGRRRVPPPPEDDFGDLDEPD